jgi:hypothetical protein
MKIKKEFKAILFCGWFITIILLTRRKGETAQLFIVLFFVIAILFYLSRLLNVWGKFRRTHENIWKRNSEKDFNILLEQDGIFSYENNQFSFPFFDNIKKYYWDDIKILIAYKEDLNTYDEIYLRILFTDRQVFEINETTPGWYKFLNKLKENISTIPENWDSEITKPAFATNTTVIFDKENRKDKIAINDSFSE